MTSATRSGPGFGRASTSASRPRSGGSKLIARIGEDDSAPCYWPSYGSNSGRPNAPNSELSNVVVSATWLPRTRSTSSLKAPNTMSPGAGSWRRRAAGWPPWAGPPLPHPVRPEGHVQQFWHGRAAAVDRWAGRHGGHDVGAHHGFGGCGVTALVHLDEPAQGVLFGGGERLGRPVRTIPGQAIAQHGAGSLQGTVHRGRAKSPGWRPSRRRSSRARHIAGPPRAGGAAATESRR